jgi:uncharacterized phiE125 gp8 family phage protein
MNIEVIGPPLFEPVSVGDAYLQLRLGDPKSEDLEAHPFYSQIVRNITTARLQVEQMTRRALVQQTLRISYPGFTCGGRGLELRRPPLREVLGVQYRDGDNALQTVELEDWFVTDDLVPRLRFVEGWSAPDTFARRDAVSIEYVAGYPPDGSPPADQEDWAAGVPAPLKDAILIGVEILQGAMSPGDRELLEQARENLVCSYRIHSR